MDESKWSKIDNGNPKLFNINPITIPELRERIALVKFEILKKGASPLRISKIRNLRAKLHELESKS